MTRQLNCLATLASLFTFIMAIQASPIGDGELPAADSPPERGGLSPHTKRLIVICTVLFTILFLAASCWLCYKIAQQDREIDRQEKSIQLAALEFRARTHNLQVWTPIEPPTRVYTRDKPSGNLHEAHAAEKRASHPIAGDLATEVPESPPSRGRRLL